MTAAGQEAGFDAWTALGMLVQLAVTEPAATAAAREMLEADLLALDLACSRFRPDSELVAVGNAARGAAGEITVPVSPLLAEAVAVALRAARLTDGDVDPTVGGVLAELGYDRDFAELCPPDLAPPDLAPPGPVLPGPVLPGLAPDQGAVGVRVIPGWRSVRVDTATGRLTVPAGVRLDLGATVKGWAADLSAARIAASLGCGVLVSLGGDTAVAGRPPGDGWRIRVQDRTALPGERPDGPSQVITIRDGGLATSSTAARRWRRGGDVLHHILDPRTARPAAPVWRTVSVAAASCADANTAATAAIIRGRQALPWLTGLRLPARLVELDGTVRTLAAWPADPAATSPAGSAPAVLLLVEQPVEGDRGRPGLLQRAQRRTAHRVVVLGEGLVAELLERRRLQLRRQPVVARPGQRPGEQPGEDRPDRPPPVAGRVVGGRAGRGGRGKRVTKGRVPGPARPC
jgi:thiamine biosynthesis lipoprotein